MSKELIKAVQNNDLKHVIQILSDPDVDINYVADIHGEKFTPLKLAMKNHSDEIALCLLEHNAGLYDWECKSKNVDVKLASKPDLFYAVQCGVAKSVFKEMLSRVHFINPDHNNIRLSLYLAQSSKADYLPYLAMLLHEAIFDANTSILHDVFKYFPDVRLDKKSMAAYVSGSLISDRRMHNAKSVCQYLVDRGHINLSDAKEIMQVLKEHRLHKNVELEDFPDVLKSMVSHVSIHSLANLLKELMAWLYPEEQLLPALYAEKLQDFLASTEDDIVYRLCAALDTHPHFTAFHLLGKILLHYANNMVVIDGREVPLISSEQYKTCMRALHKYHLQSDYMLEYERADGRYALIISSLLKQNKVLRKENEQLHTEVDALNHKSSHQTSRKRKFNSTETGMEDEGVLGKYAERFLVIGYNQCAYTLNGSNPQLLSNPLIQFAKQNAQYDGFYGMTGRCYINLGNLYNHSLAKLPGKGNYNTSDLNDNFFTYQITDHFADQTGLHNETVSTLEDIKLGECGAGYEKILKPYESSGSLPTGKYIDDLTSMYTLLQDHQTQLLQIAKDVVKRHPEAASIRLDVVDDKTTHLKYAMRACNDATWPKNVKVRAYRHDADSDKAEVKEIDDLTIKHRVVKADVPSSASKQSVKKRVMDHDDTLEAAAKLRKSGQGMFARTTRSMTKIAEAKDAKSHRPGTGR